MEKTDFFKLFPVIQRFAVNKSVRKVAYDWSIRSGVRSLQGPINSASSTMGIKLRYTFQVEVTQDLINHFPMGRQTVGDLKLKDTVYSTRAIKNFGVRRHPE